MKILYTEHALVRMRQRDVVEEDIIVALQRPSSSHCPGLSPNKYEVDAIIGARTITVVYMREKDTFKIITVF